MKLAILTSGGDAPGMNPVIRAVTRTAIYNDIEVYGVKDGYEGLINGDLYPMDESSVGDIIHRGGTILGTARSDEFETEEGQNKAMNILRVYNIDSLIVLGGDGSFRGALALEKKGMNVITIPCTIDNDLGYTDYSIGFWTAIETAIDAIGKLRDTSSSHGRANVVELMGRDSGELALYAALAGGAESIIVPETPSDIDQIIRVALRGRQRGKTHNLVIVAEGSGDTYKIAEELREKTGIDTRVTVLGHVQRGGSPSAQDRIYGSIFGRMAVELLKSGKSGKAIGIKCNEAISIDIEEAINTKAKFNKEIYETIKILSI